ncbi:MAG: c-type cytochrome [Acidimicrobiia bacterium]|nr:c-type cytochrome [Acidimicrobiia bacterium]
MTRSRLLTFAIAFVIALTATGCGGDAATQGGLLYDKWWVVTEGVEPTSDAALWATQSTNERTGADTWRCKECHGWDYRGADGAYGSGSHFTGFVGIWDARNDTVEDVVDAMSGGLADHDFSAVLSEGEINDIAVFITESLVDMSTFIDLDTKAITGGDAAEGENLYTRECAACHGADGTDPNLGSDEEPESVGSLANANPWEVTHKILYGHPGSDPEMPALTKAGWGPEELADILSFLQTLP